MVWIMSDASMQHGLELHTLVRKKKVYFAGRVRCGGRPTTIATEAFLGARYCIRRI